MGTNIDEQLLTKAEEPGALETVGQAISGFAAGAYSWPFDYMLCMQWIAGSTGIYGSTFKERCDYHTQRVLMVLDHTLSLAHYLIFRGVLFQVLGSEEGMRATKELVSRISGEQAAQAFRNNLPRIAYTGSKMVGRSMSGAAFTAWMQTGGRIGTAVSTGRRVGIASFNFLALLWGSAIHVSCKAPSGFDVVSIFISWLTGDPTVQISPDQYKELFRAVMQAGEAAFQGADRADYENYRSVVQQLLNFGRQGGGV